MSYVTKHPATCVICGAEFMPAQDSLAKTCSIACKTRLVWQIRGVQPPQDKVCKDCGKTFTVLYKNRGRMFCSNACRIRYLHKHHRRPITHEFHACLECGDLVKVWPSLAHRKRFCSRSCLAKYRVRTHAINSPTTIETKVYAALNLMRVEYTPQYGMGRYVVDAWLPTLKTIIEADGAYWHSLPDRQARDAKLAAYAERMGFRLIRLDEQLIRSLDENTLAQHIQKHLS